MIGTSPFFPHQVLLGQRYFVLGDLLLVLLISQHNEEPEGLAVEEGQVLAVGEGQVEEPEGLELRESQVVEDARLL